MSLTILAMRVPKKPAPTTTPFWLPIFKQQVTPKRGAAQQAQSAQASKPTARE